MSHVKFVHWAARLPNSDKLCNSFRAAGTNGRLDFSLSLLAACGSVICPCRMLPESKELRLGKESVACGRRSSAGWMSKRTGRLSVGVGHKHPVTIRKASLRTMSMRRVCALRHQAGAQNSAVEQIGDKAALRNVLAPAPHPEPPSPQQRDARGYFFAQCLKVMMVREHSVQFHTEIGRHWTKWQDFNIVLNF